MVVISPAIQRSIVEDGTGVPSSSSNRESVLPTGQTDLYRRGTVRGRTVTNLTVTVPPPAFERGVVEDGTGVP